MRPSLTSTGRLVDTVGDFVAARNLMRGELWPQPAGGAAVDAATVTQMVGKGSGHLIRAVLNHVQAQEIRARPAINLIAIYAPAFARYQHHYQAVSGRYSTVSPGALEGVRAAGCPVMPVTDGYNHGEPVRAVDADGFVDSRAGLFAGVWRGPSGFRRLCRAGRP